MRELKHVLGDAARLRDDGTPYVLATVVRVEGSSYRYEGARMLIRPDGGTAGTVSGGCLEGEVAQQALRVLKEGRPPEVLTLEQEEGEDPFGFGSGCGGTVHLLLEPVRPGQGDAGARAGALALMQHCFDERQIGALVTVYKAEGDLAGERGRHLLVRAGAPPRGDVRSGSLRAALRAEAEEALRQGQMKGKTHRGPGGVADALIEIVRPPLRLLVFGEGQDAAPLVRQAGLLGWTVAVVGAAPAPELESRFPNADACLSLPHPEALAKRARLGKRDAAVVMTHNYLRDRTLLRRLLPSRVGYVGVMGARRRLDRLREDFAEGDRPRDEAAHAAVEAGRLSGPVGLDIGAEAPEEIALSIVAEVQAVFSGRAGGRLSRATGRIHPHRDRPVVAESAPASRVPAGAAS